VTSKVMAETLFGFGCYVGEVFVRAAGGYWVDSATTGINWRFPLVVKLGEDAGDPVVNPIEKVFKRLDNGIEDNLPYFFAAFAGAKTALQG
jgi:hypothetical protein